MKVGRVAIVTRGRHAGKKVRYVPVFRAKVHGKMTCLGLIAIPRALGWMIELGC